MVGSGGGRGTTSLRSAEWLESTPKYLSKWGTLGAARVGSHLATRAARALRFAGGLVDDGPGGVDVDESAKQSRPASSIWLARLAAHLETLACEDFRSQGDRRMEGACLTYLALIELDAGRSDTALEAARTAAEALEQVPPPLAYALAVLAKVELACGQTAAALDAGS